MNVYKSYRKAWLALPLAMLLVGCERGVGPQELGDVHFADPEVPGSREAYPLPQLKEPQAPAGASADAKRE